MRLPAISIDGGQRCAWSVPSGHEQAPLHALASNRFVIALICTPAQSSVGKPAFSSFSTIERSVPASSTASAPSRRISVCASSRSRSMPAGVLRS